MELGESCFVDGSVEGEFLFGSGRTREDGTRRSAEKSVSSLDLQETSLQTCSRYSQLPPLSPNILNRLPDLRQLRRALVHVVLRLLGLYGEFTEERNDLELVDRMKGVVLLRWVDRSKDFVRVVVGHCPGRILVLDFFVGEEEVSEEVEEMRD